MEINASFVAGIGLSLLAVWFLVVQGRFLWKHIWPGYPFVVSGINKQWGRTVFTVLFLAGAAIAFEKADTGAIARGSLFSLALVQVVLALMFFEYARRAEEIWDRSSYSLPKQYLFFTIGTSGGDLRDSGSLLALYDEIVLRRTKGRQAAYAFLTRVLGVVFRDMLPSVERIIADAEESTRAVVPAPPDAGLLSRFWQLPYPFRDKSEQKRQELFGRYLAILKKRDDALQKEVDETRNMILGIRAVAILKARDDALQKEVEETWEMILDLLSSDQPEQRRTGTQYIDAFTASGFKAKQTVLILQSFR